MGEKSKKGDGMKRYLLDTDVLIDHLRGEEKAHQFLGQLTPETSLVFYSVISKAEIYSGVRPNEEKDVVFLFKSMNEVPVDGKTAEDAGKYRREFLATHGLLLPDALIAASAKSVQAALITLNKKHYPMGDVQIMVPYGKK
jgi:hypothetical protein